MEPLAPLAAAPRRCGLLGDFLGGSGRGGFHCIQPSFPAGCPNWIPEVSLRLSHTHSDGHRTTASTHNSHRQQPSEPQPDHEEPAGGSEAPAAVAARRSEPRESRAEQLASRELRPRAAEELHVSRSRAAPLAWRLVAAAVGEGEGGTDGQVLAASCACPRDGA